MIKYRSENVRISYLVFVISGLIEHSKRKIFDELLFK
jgi:hypothetical protein